MRPIWTGAISFGLVNIPVRLHSAVRAGGRVSFRLLHKTDMAPIRYDRVCEKEQTSVPWSDIVKGYEYEKGRFVALDDDDFKRAALQSSKAFEIQDFVDAEAVDTRFFEKPYYMVPAKGGEKAYALLREAIRSTGKIGIGTISMRANSYHLAAIRVVEDALVLEIMRFANELVEVGEFDFPAADAVRPQELKMAEQLVSTLAAEFDPAKYRDEYQDNLMEIIQAKLKGKKVAYEEAPDREGTPVVDLMARLQESLERGKRSGGPESSKPAKKRAAKKPREAPARTARRRKTA
jgi:DNA end-binding protein Ku